MIEFPVQYQVNYLNSVHHGTEQAVRKFWLIKDFKGRLFSWKRPFVWRIKNVRTFIV